MPTEEGDNNRRWVYPQCPPLNWQPDVGEYIDIKCYRTATTHNTTWPRILRNRTRTTTTPATTTTAIAERETTEADIPTTRWTRQAAKCTNVTFGVQGDPRTSLTMYNSVTLTANVNRTCYRMRRLNATDYRKSSGALQYFDGVYSCCT